MTERLHERLVVLRCQTADDAAFEELFRLYHPRLRYFLRKMLAGPIEDLAQEVWLDVLRGLGRLRDAGAFPAWFYRIARDRAWRHLRRRGQPAQLPPEDDLPCAAADEEEFSAEDAQLIHAALDRLSPEHREVLLLRFVEDMSYERIAEVVQCPLGTVRSRIHHAKHMLRRLIEEVRQP